MYGTVANACHVFVTNIYLFYLPIDAFQLLPKDGLEEEGWEGWGTLSQFEEAGLEEEGWEGWGTLSQFEEAGLVEEGWEGWGTLSQFEEADLMEEGWEGWGTLHHSCSLKEEEWKCPVHPLPIVPL